MGELPAIPVVTEGHGPPLPNLKLKDAADALLYLGPPGSLQMLQMSPSELAGTPYWNEIERRMKLQMALENRRSVPGEGNSNGEAEHALRVVTGVVGMVVLFGPWVWLAASTKEFLGTITRNGIRDEPESPL